MRPSSESEESESDDQDQEHSEEEFEDQGSDSDEAELLETQAQEGEEDDEDEMVQAETMSRSWSLAERETELARAKRNSTLAAAQHIHVDDLSSDDDTEDRNAIDQVLKRDGSCIPPHRSLITDWNATTTHWPGRVPLHWYDEYDHIGYSRAGKKVLKSEGDGNEVDAVDAALAREEDPDFARTVYDAYNMKKVVLSDREMEIIRRLQAGAIAHPEHDAHPDYVDYASHEKEKMPLGSDHESKRRFLPSKWEMMKVHKILQGMREGKIQLEKKKKPAGQAYEMWPDGEEFPDRHRGPMHIPAPKLPLPGHAESYRPPEEYLMTEEEEKAWDEMDPEERPLNFKPKRFSSLRAVGAYEGFVKERFERCLDLYLCPRTFKRRLNIDPESLVPELPKPRDLKPFPHELCLEYRGHKAKVRCVSCSADGQWLATGDDAGMLKIWEVCTGRTVHTVDLTGHGAVAFIAWNPSAEHRVVAVAAGNSVFLITPGSNDITEALLSAAVDGQAQQAEEGTKLPPVEWIVKKEKLRMINGQPVGIRIQLKCTGEVGWLAWHRKGDYLATVVPRAGNQAVIVHQLSRAQSQCPFKKTKGEVQCVSFHPNKPFFFVATKQHVRIYHLVKQVMVKRLLTGCKWISCIAVHSTGDHLLVGSYDRRVSWFDLDLSDKPFRTLKYHSKAVRGAVYHSSYPLMATASDDGKVHVFHAMVYSDLLRNPFIVPLKVIQGHAVTGGLGVLGLCFHPKQPWLFSAGADGVVRLFQD